MEFKEFSNPESKDYDIKSSFGEESASNSGVSNPYVEKLIDLIGILEDFTDEELQNDYGISVNEYFNPTAETIAKVSKHINIRESVKHK